MRLTLTPPSGLNVPIIEWFKRLALALGTIAVGVELTGVSVQTTETAIPHGLGSRPKSFRVLPYGDARVWRTKAPDATFIYLAASAAVVCDVWCY